MRFKLSEHGQNDLGLPAGTADRVFTGPSIEEGLMGGIPVGVQRWAKRELKVNRLDTLDTIEARLLYYVIAIRNTDHQLLPIARFDDLALNHFEMVPHPVTSYDRDGDCGECSAGLGAPWHTEADPEQVPPTSAAGGPETTATS